MQPRRSVPIDDVYVSRAPSNMPSSSSEGQIVVSLVKQAASSPRVRTLTLFWLVGLFAMLWAPAPIHVTDEMKHVYEAKLVDAAHIENYDETYAALLNAEEAVAEAQVWFWRFRPEHRAVVDARQAIATQARTKLNHLDDLREAKMREAKAYVGLWSDYGLNEVRARFWAAFDSGKVFASRQTFWQMVFSVLQSREENVISLIFHWAFVALINFTFGLIGSLFYFTASLFSMVFTYNPDPLSAVAFVGLALLGAVAVVASYLLGIYAMAASSVYVVGKLAVHSARIQYEDQRAAPAHLRQRPHHE
ncbi:hypothetical protein H310_07879 [Aphanomyces invadans]|uniref:Uncharacterized protein n=2 Tax=Aphanomyces invadans TaxID=157072 RepID=A0A024U0Q8_9STRA|nr:hypothetical protein H310_07879 [Aphanomyces invadans]ETV99838.1 hypothetical protein H310_07879 [Aphanomyces invadans]|eukprot:XP_008871614.1 hypothetical protein H310_07879 [Aphanomyces invadans]